MSDSGPPIGRGDFFRSLLRSLGSLLDDVVGDHLDKVAERLEENFPTLLRPPGALPEETFLKTCRRCGECVRACPHYVLRLYFRPQSFFEKTPFFEPGDAFCRMCEGFPCISACPSGALRRPERGQPLIGRAHIDASICLNGSITTPTVCNACIPVCPSRFSALRAPEGALHPPVVITDNCCGCGACVAACPTRPHPAVKLTPIR